MRRRAEAMGGLTLPECLLSLHNPKHRPFAEIRNERLEYCRINLFVVRASAGAARVWLQEMHRRLAEDAPVSVNELG
jgi:hypothetical protein